MIMTWTADRIAELERLWATGATTAEIGRRLEISKNAVVGKAHRLGLPGRPSPIRREALPPPPAVVDLRGPPCQWPFGDPGGEDFHFCGAPVVADRPYCREHCARAYVRGEREVRAA